MNITSLNQSNAPFKQPSPIQRLSDEGRKLFQGDIIYPQTIFQTLFNKEVSKEASDPSVEQVAEVKLTSKGVLERMALVGPGGLVLSELRLDSQLENIVWDKAFGHGQCAVLAQRQYVLLIDLKNRRYLELNKSVLEKHLRVYTVELIGKDTVAFVGFHVEVPNRVALQLLNVSPTREGWKTFITQGGIVVGSTDNVDRDPSRVPNRMPSIQIENGCLAAPHPIYKCLTVAWELMPDGLKNLERQLSKSPSNLIPVGIPLELEKDIPPAKRQKTNPITGLKA